MSYEVPRTFAPILNEKEFETSMTDTRVDPLERNGLLPGEFGTPRGSRRSRSAVEETRGKSMKMFGRRLPLPENRWLRMTIGVLLVIGGLLGFLPILGLWMMPLGFVVLSIDLPWVRRWRRRSEVWGSRKYRGWKDKRGTKGKTPRAH